MIFTRDFKANKNINGYHLYCHVMCDCPSVHFYEVDFKLAGMRVVPTHKNCGESLNDNQFSKFEKELIKYWRFDEKE